VIEIDLAEITEPILACPNDPRESVRLDKGKVSGLTNIQKESLSSV
jgi:aconitase B